MQDMVVYGTAQPAAQQNWTREPQTDAVEIEESDASSLSARLSQAEEESQSLVEMIRTAQEKAEAQREALKMPKNNTRYGDAPLEAYARLARAKSAAQVNSASGYARRRLAQFKTALRTDSENSAKIKAAINQLQKAINRGEKKKRELNRERLTEIRRKRAAEEDRKSQEQRLRQELRRRRSQRMIRESGYMKEAEISDRLASHLTATQMELRQQAQELTAAAAASVESAVQQYTSTAAAAAAPMPADAGFTGQA